MSQLISMSTPLSAEQLEKVRIGDRVHLSGTIYSARDAAHKRLLAQIRNRQPLPFDLQGQVIYYLGPTPAKPGEAIGAAGPTTSYRMDPYAPELIEKGLKGMIGKGTRGQDVITALKKFKAVYFAAVGGAGALISKCIVSAEIIAYPILLSEAIRRLEVKDFPVIVANDIYGGDLYEQGMKTYAR